MPSTLIPPTLFAKVANRGAAPIGFLKELVAWARQAPAAIFAVNSSDSDIYSSTRGTIGPWHDTDYRRAAMCEVLRVLAGFESSWKWNCGVDVTNKRSLSQIQSQEAGIFQVSFDSAGFGTDLKKLLKKHQADTPATFITQMKLNHGLAFEYCARLLRHTCRHNGPVLRREIHPYLTTANVLAFESLI